MAVQCHHSLFLVVRHPNKVPPHVYMIDRRNETNRGRLSRW